MWEQHLARVDPLFPASDLDQQRPVGREANEAARPADPARLNNQNGSGRMRASEPARPDRVEAVPMENCLPIVEAGENPLRDGFRIKRCSKVGEAGNVASRNHWSTQKVGPEPDHQPAGSNSGAALDQDAGQLGVPEQDVVRPLQPKQGITAERLVQRQGSQERPQGRLVQRAGGAKQHGQSEVSGLASPGTAAAAPTLRLAMSQHGQPRRLARLGPGDAQVGRGRQAVMDFQTPAGASAGHHPFGRIT